MTGEFVLVCLSSESEIRLNNGDVLNMLHGLQVAHEAAGGLATEYGKLYELMAATFKDDVR